LVAAWPFFAARQFDKAIVQLQRVVDLDDNYPEAYNFLGRCFEAQSNFLAAIEAWRKYDLLVGHDRDRVNSSYDALRQAYLQFGEQGYLRKFIELIRENESLPEDDQIFYAWDLAGYYARLGENEKALDEIETHLEEWRLRSQLKFEPMFDSLHDLPRFKALLKRAGLEP
jgi:tetratricopeptide (TPR) repeat protein